MSSQVNYDASSQQRNTYTTDMVKQLMTEEEGRAVKQCMTFGGIIPKSLPYAALASFGSHFFCLRWNAPKVVRLIVPYIVGFGAFASGQSMIFVSCLQRTAPHVLDAVKDMRREEIIARQRATQVPFHAKRQDTDDVTSQNFNDRELPVYDISPVESNMSENPSSMETDLTETTESKKTLSYADLRRKNREDWQKKHQSSMPPVRQTQPEEQEPQIDYEQRRAPRVRRNQYGDIID